MRRIVAFALAIIIVITSFNVEAEAAELKLYAHGAALIDGNNYRLLYGYNENEVLPMASTTKIMTLLIALENGNLDDIVTFSPYAASQPDVQLNAKAGEQYYLKDLLYMMMLQSYNDVAVAVAEHIGRKYTSVNAAQSSLDESREAVGNFVSLMNDKARALGLYNTYFVTPNGLDGENEGGCHSTTAYELAIIAATALQNPMTERITTTRSYHCKEINNKRNISINTTDKFLDMCNGAIGLKTGFTGKAGYCFVGAVRQEERLFISVVLASSWPPNKSHKWADTQKLMNYAIKNYFSQKISVEDNISIVINNGTKDTARAKVDENFELLLSDDEEVSVVYRVKDYVEAPVKAGETLGNAYVYVDGALYKICPIRCNESVNRIDFWWHLRRMFYYFIP